MVWNCKHLWTAVSTWIVHQTRIILFCFRGYWHAYMHQACPPTGCSHCCLISTSLQPGSSLMGLSASPPTSLVFTTHQQHLQLKINSTSMASSAKPPQTIPYHHYANISKPHPNSSFYKLYFQTLKWFTTSWTCLQYHCLLYTHRP